jgi:hypothetical protein
VRDHGCFTRYATRATGLDSLEALAEINSLYAVLALRFLAGVAWVYWNYFAASPADFDANLKALAMKIHGAAFTYAGGEKLRAWTSRDPSHCRPGFTNLLAVPRRAGREDPVQPFNPHRDPTLRLSELRTLIRNRVITGPNTASKTTGVAVNFRLRIDPCCSIFTIPLRRSLSRIFPYGRNNRISA